VVVDELVERAHPNAQPFGIGPRIRGVEREIRIDRERAVLVDLRHAAQLGVVIPKAELQLVVALLAGDEPGVVVLDLVVRIPRPLRLGTRLTEKVQVAELRRALRLIARSLVAKRETLTGVVRAGLATEAGVTVPPVLPRPRQTHRVDTGVAEYGRQRADGRLIEVGFILVGFERSPGGHGPPLRRPLAQPAHGPRVRTVDLMIE